MANTISVSITSQTKGLQRGLNQAKGQLTGFRGGVQKATLGLGTLVKGFALVYGASAAGKFLGGSISEARDLNETLNKSNVIFGKSAGSISKWGNNAAQNFGLSKNEAVGAAAAFGDMFLQLGFSEKAAVKFSKANVQMAADLGSFNNLETSDVLERLSAAYRGEYDSLQKVIPNISAARVEKEALRMTGKETVKQLTAEDKAMAVNAIVTRDGARANGDFAKTSGGLANQQKILSAKTKDLQAKLGKLLLPAMTKLAGYAIDVVDGLSDMGPMLDKIKASVSGFFSGFSGGSGKASAQWTQFKSTVSSVWTSLKSTFQSAITIIQSLWRMFGDTILNYLRGILTNIMSALRGAFTIIQGIFNVFAGILKGDWSRVWTGIKQILSGAWTLIKAIIKAAWNTIATAFRIGGTVIKAIFKGLWNALKAIVSAAWNGIKSLVRSGINGAKNAISSGWNAAKSLTSKAWSAMKSAVSSGISKVVSTVKALPSKIKSGLGSLKGTLTSVGADLIRGLITGIGSMANAAIDKVKGVISGAKNAAKNLLGINSPSKVFKGFGENTIQGLILGIDGKSGALAKTMANVAKVVAGTPLTLSPVGASYVSGSHLSVQPASSRGTTVINVTVHAPVGSDPISIGKEIRSYLDEWDRVSRR